MDTIIRIVRYALFAALLYLGASAAHAAPAPSPSPSPQTIKAVWDYKTELGLTDKQVADMRAAVQSLEDVVSVAQGKLQLMNAKLSQQITSNASLDTIRITLEEIAAVQIEVKLTDVRVSRTMNQILTAEQMKKWREIQQRAEGPPKP